MKSRFRCCAISGIRSERVNEISGVFCADDIPKSPFLQAKSLKYKAAPIAIPVVRH